jgi:hypothetical protein
MTYFHGFGSASARPLVFSDLGLKSGGSHGETPETSSKYNNSLNQTRPRTNGCGTLLL